MAQLVRTLAAALCGALLALAPVQAQAQAPAACAFPSPPQVLSSAGAKGEKGSRLLQVWETPDAAVYWSDEAPNSAAFENFRRGAARLADATDPVALLARSPGFNNSLLVRYNQLVASRAPEWIRPAGCLERLLLSVQHDRVDTFERPTEFAAIVLRSPDRRRLRIYYLTVNEDWIGRATPLTEPALGDHRAGWQLLLTLHNHNFHPGQASLNGVLAPSEADAQMARNLAQEAGLQAAWITNGLHTSRIPAAAFDLFQP